MTRDKRIFVLLLLFMSFGLHAQTVNQGRVAVVADGNYRDSDDICATPVSLGIFRALGLNDKVVHYSHSCDLQKGSSDPGGAFREAEMQTSCDGTASSWGGFDGLTFFNAFRDQDATIDDLTIHINNSTSSDPLWIIEAGEPDIMYEAVLQATPSKRQHIYVISHHPANDRGDFHDLDDVMALGIPDNHLHYIPNQNDLLKKDLNNWHWARDHSDSRIQWLWDRGYTAQTDAMMYNGIRGDFDCSDAGMIYYWATLPSGGDENCDIPKLKALFNNYISNVNEIVGPEGYTFSVDETNTVVITDVPYDIAYGHNGSYLYKENQTDDVLCSNTSFGDDPLPGTKKYCFIRESKVSYTGSPTVIPGTIETENYDFGGAGRSYNDVDSENNGGLDFRGEQGVDIDDLPSGNGYAVGWIRKGEWLEYTINVGKSGQYDMKVSYSSKNGGGSIGLDLDGSEIASGITIPTTDDWNLYNDLIETVSLTEGEHVLRVNMEEAGFNLDKLEFAESSITSVNNTVRSSLIEVFPNPSSQGLFNLSEKTQWKIYSARGIKILEGNSNNVNLTNQPKGLYILKTLEETVTLVVN